MLYDNPSNKYIAAYSVAAASNYGALFMAHCSLAGLMWQNLVNNSKITSKIWKLICLVSIFMCIVSPGIIILMYNLVY